MLTVLGQNATFEHEMSTMLKMEMWRAHPCSRLIFAEYKGFITPVYGGGCAAAILVKAPPGVVFLSYTTQMHLRQAIYKKYIYIEKALKFFRLHQG